MLSCRDPLIPRAAITPSPQLNVFIPSIKSCYSIVSCRTTLEPYDSDSMAREFVGQFRNRMISIGERLVFCFQDKEPLVLIVKDLKRTCCNGSATFRFTFC